MTEQEVRQRVMKIIGEQLGIPEDEIAPESNVVDDLGADSLDIVEIGLTLEDTFSVVIENSELEPFNDLGAQPDQRTVGHLIELVLAKRAALGETANG